MKKILYGYSFEFYFHQLLVFCYFGNANDGYIKFPIRIVKSESNRIILLKINPSYPAELNKRIIIVKFRSYSADKIIILRFCFHIE